VFWTQDICWPVCPSFQFGGNQVSNRGSTGFIAHRNVTQRNSTTNVGTSGAHEQTSMHVYYIDSIEAMEHERAASKVGSVIKIDAALLT
jgi:hypothetical protein